MQNERYGKSDEINLQNQSEKSNKPETGGPDADRVVPKKIWILDPANRWPLGIIILYMVFISGTLVMVFIGFSTPVNLEKEDYYEATLLHQEHIDRVSRTMSMKEQVRFEFGEGRRQLHVHFPAEHALSGISGRIHLFRPSDNRMDREVAIQTDSDGIQSISISELQRGYWILKVHWDAGGEDYYWQNSLHL